MYMCVLDLKTCKHVRTLYMYMYQEKSHDSVRDGK